MILWKHKRFTAVPLMFTIAFLSKSLIGTIVFGIIAVIFYIRK